MNSHLKNYFYLTLGIIGACISLYGYLFQNSEPQLFYIIGFSALLITAIYYNLLYFIALEIILISDHLALVLGSGPYTQYTLPVLLCLQLFFVYSLLEKNHLLFFLLGILGIALFSIGLASNNHLVFFFGSLLIAIYSFYRAYKEQKAAYLWAALNAIFALVALGQMINLF